MLTAHLLSIGIGVVVTALGGVLEARNIGGARYFRHFGGAITAIAALRIAPFSSTAAVAGAVVAATVGIALVSIVFEAATPEPRHGFGH